MKNLTLRTKLNLLWTGIFLFVVLTLFYLVYIWNRVSEAPTGTVARWMIPFLIVSIIFLVFASILLNDILRSMTEPFRSVEGVLEKISEGDFAVQESSAALESQEEFGNLAKAIGKMQKSVGVLVGGIKSETAGISDTVNGIQSHISGMSSEMEDIFIAAEELSDSLKAAEEAADKIERFSIDMEGAASHMAARAKEGTEWAADIRNRALYAKETALDKSEAVRIGKKDIRDSLAKTLNDAKIIEQISVLAESVVEITEQVNLLSLNAGMEAARSGEAGKEFAVFAEEIHNLTEQSKKYAENIQWAVDEVTSALVCLRKDAKRLLEFIDRDVFTTFNLFVRMADTYNSDAGEMNFMASDVGTASEELLALVGDIGTSLEDIRKAAKACGGGITGIADQSVHAAARISAMEEGFQGAKDAAKRLEEITGRLTLEAEPRE